jgi:hypothetical protein
MPRNFAIGVASPDLHGVSLEQAYRDGTITLRMVQDILAKEFLCDLEDKFVRPADAGKVTLEGVAPADRSSGLSG